MSDIGGTTTDITVSQWATSAGSAGGPSGPLSHHGRACCYAHLGFGGDSEVHFLSEGLQGGVLLGPKRALPIILAAIEAPDLVHDALDRQLHTALPGEYDGRFVRRLSGR